MVQRAPFGLVIKKCRGGSYNEANALKLVDEHTSIPAPRLVDIGNYKGELILVMTYISGTKSRDVLHLMSYPERNRFADDLSACVAQLRQIPNNTPYMFANTLGGPLIDHRIPDSPQGPCNSEADFYDLLTDDDIGGTAAQFFGDDYHTLRQDHRSFFTHSDFWVSNLIVDRGRLAGVVDWECAGYKPEYWEFTKAMWLVRAHPDWEALFRRTFGHQYEDELRNEITLWFHTPYP